MKPTSDIENYQLFGMFRRREGGRERKKNKKKKSNKKKLHE